MKDLRESETVAEESNGGAKDEKHPPPPAPPPWESLSDDIIVECLSYCDVLDLVPLRRSSGIFRRAARVVVSRSETLDLSVLSNMNSSRGRNRRKYVQKQLVAHLLQGASISLQKLDLGGLQYIRGALADPLRTCRNLTSLSLNGCSSLCPRLFRRAIILSAADLLHLDLTGCRQLEIMDIKYAAAMWPHLQTLHLGGSIGMEGVESLLIVAVYLRHLRVLDLSDLTFTCEDASAGVALLMLPSSLESLSIRKCRGFQTFSLENLMTALLALFIHRLQEDSLLALVSQVRSGHIDEVWAELYPDMDDRFVANVVVLRAAPAGLRASDVGVMFTSLMASGWTNLRVLNFSLHFGMDDIGLPMGGVALLSVFLGGSLREVDVSNCPHVTDEDIEILAATCADSLTIFKASGTAIGNRAAKALGSHCFNLAVLDLSHCPLIRDEGFLALCPTSGVYTRMEDDDGAVYYTIDERRGCPSFKSLSIGCEVLPVFGWTGLTETSLLAIAGLYLDDEHGMLRAKEGGMEQLESLNVRGVNWNHQSPHMTAQRVMAELPRLEEVQCDTRGSREPEVVTRADLPSLS